ncbi:la domain-containing protein [Ditylenchus destructor]|nr:la domain-containing protein [Ditylenchus destructor]
MTEIDAKSEATGNGAPVNTTTQSTSVPDEKAKRIIDQVEYYFGDINLPRDKFLQGEMKKEFGWVSLTTMLNFNRLAKITEDVNEIATALQNSSLIEISDDKEKIRRSQDHPPPENTLEYWQEIKQRTVYVKGFPQTATLDEIIQFINQHGKTQNVTMRFTKSIPKIFKGSVFATFETKETAEKVASNEEIKEYNSEPIFKLMQEDYFSKKNKERRDKKEAEKQIKQAKKSQTVEEQKQSLAATNFVKGLILKVSGVPENTDTMKLKEFFAGFGDVAYASRSGNETLLRIGGEKENAAQELWEKAKEAGSGKVVYNEAELSSEVISGDEEQNYWTEFHKSKIAKAERLQSDRKRKHTNKENTQRGSRGKKRSAEDEAEVEKKSKRIVFKDEDEVDATVEVKSEAVPADPAENAAVA